MRTLLLTITIMWSTCSVAGGQAPQPTGSDPLMDAAVRIGKERQHELAEKRKAEERTDKYLAIPFVVAGAGAIWWLTRVFFAPPETRGK